MSVPNITTISHPHTPLLPKGADVHGGQGSAKVVNLTTNNTTTINLPSGTPQSVANEYGKAVDGKNAQIAKNAQGVLR